MLILPLIFHDARDNATPPPPVVLRHDILRYLYSRHHMQQTYVYIRRVVYLRHTPATILLLIVFGAQLRFFFTPYAPRHYRRSSTQRAAHESRHAITSYAPSATPYVISRCIPAALDATPRCANSKIAPRVIYIIILCRLFFFSLLFFDAIIIFIISRAFSSPFSMFKIFLLFLFIYLLFELFKDIIFMPLSLLLTFHCLLLFDYLSFSLIPDAVSFSFCFTPFSRHYYLLLRRH